MSMDASLKSASSLVRHRNVLTRAERLERLGGQGKWDDKKSVYGLPKVGNRKLIVGGKPKKEEAAEGDAAAGAKGAKGAKAAAAKGAAPAAKAAKGAAPAAKAAKGAPAKK